MLASVSCNVKSLSLLYLVSIRKDLGFLFSCLLERMNYMPGFQVFKI
jgi:hypothetical protein